MAKSRFFYVIVSILLLLVAIAVYLFFRNRRTTVDIVIARYEEDISWLNELPIRYDRLFIYNKGSPITFSGAYIIELPNLGRESHTYFHHVINNYHNLADLTYFLPGSVWTTDFKKIKLLKTIENLKTDFRSTIVGISNEEYKKNLDNFVIDTYEVTNETNRKKNPDANLVKSELRPFKVWFDAHFPGEKVKCVGYNGIMAVTRESIQKRSIDEYAWLKQEHSIKNAEVVHFSERAWSNIFSTDVCLPVP